MASLLHWDLQQSFLAPCKRIRNPESSKFLLLESEIQRLESGIHNGSRIQMLGSGIQDLRWILFHGATFQMPEVAELRHADSHTRRRMRTLWNSWQTLIRLVTLLCYHRQCWPARLMMNLQVEQMCSKYIETDLLHIYSTNTSVANISYCYWSEHAQKRCKFIFMHILH